MWSQFEAGFAEAGGPHERDPAYRRLNVMFHSSIHRMAHSQAVTAIASSLWDRSDFYIKLAFGSLYFSKAVRNAHRLIHDAIVAGDADTARAAVSNHLLSVGKRVADKLDVHRLAD